MPELGDNMLIFSDLDGSLLDHETYDWQPAAPCLRRLKQHDIPVIITTSKTACETTLIRRELGLEHCPFIAENGASIALPGHWHTHADYPCKLFSTGYVEICALLERLRLEHHFNFIGFATLTDSDVATLTGLPLADAKRARERHASEPLLWHDDDTALQRFIHQLNNHGLALTHWGLEIGVLSEIHRGTATSRICQVDIADNYDHKHQPMSEDNPDAGLQRMAMDITKALYRKLPIQGVAITTDAFRVLRATYYRTALDMIDAFEHDAKMNGLAFDRHGEELAVELFSEVITASGHAYSESPGDKPFVPSWNRVQSAFPDILERLYQAVEADNAAE